MSKRTRKNIKVMLVGSGGRMGQAIAKLIAKEKSMRLARNEKPDLVIEFSSPEGMRETIKWCVQHKVPLVSGTTGITQADRALLKRASKKIPLLYSANMSLGIAVMNAMLRQFARVSDWTFRMEEIHHTKKKDKPSGTAKLLSEQLRTHVPIKNLPIKAIRKGQVPGTHQIEAFGPDETLLLKHTAHDRRIFARGAIRAARWLFDKNKPGLYDLGDLYAG